MEATAARTKEELLDRLVEELGRRLPPEQRGSAGELLRRCYATAPAEELAELSLDQAVGAVLCLWRAGARRRPGEVVLAAYNPRPEEHGYSSPHTALDVVNDDMPFLLASVSGELHQRERRLHQVLHPVLAVERDEEGAFVRFAPPGAGRAESWMHLEVDRETQGSAGLAELAERLRSVLGDVRRAVGDWQAMRRQVEGVMAELAASRPPVPADEVEEARDFLEWLLDNHFTFLGYRRYRLERGAEDRLRVEPDSGLGLLAEVTPESQERSDSPLPQVLADFIKKPELLIITKASRRSTVHRPVHMDSVGVRRFDESGQVVGEHRFLGLFTSTVYTVSAQTIPLLRRKVRRVLEAADFSPGSHDAKLLVHILETFPRDELFQISEADLSRIAIGVLQLQQRQRVALFVRRDEFERFVSCLVFVPRERYTFELRQRMQRLLERAYAASVTAFYTQMADAPLARVHFILRTTPGEIPDVDPRRLEAELELAARSWKDHLREHLVAAHGEEIGLGLLAGFGDAFPLAYQERSPAKAALPDIEVMQVLRGSGEEFAARLYREPGGAPECMRLKLYRAGRHISLSDALPILENMGVWVESEIPFEVEAAGGGTSVWVHDFELRSADGAPIPYEEARKAFEETLQRVWAGDLENGILNQLVLCCGLAWHEVTVLRAYSRYLRQIGMTFSQRYMAQTLVRNGEVARLLVQLFHVLFDPAAQEDFRSRAAGTLAEIRQQLEGVKSLDEDRILRGFLNVIKATLRTNAYQRAPGGERKEYLSFKLDSRAVRHLPEPRPMTEIFVYSPRVEGIHLRGGKVARGGIRWSDRREDFRTEILGLLKAQMVKNAVIVPVGAKGGFVVKRPPAGGREAQQAEGVACYRTLIRGLLDLTDNLVGGEVVSPPDVVRRDGDDPYLVVAADKGTATFSDLANGIAAEYGFWLGDAFASGGSAGYDHKRMGITARGAWEAVKRHFREMGRDIQRQDFTCVGVGDMSGDVFGNGMLLSPRTRLLGAFNHLHVFVDPSPDAKASLAERQRLFALPRSTWADYDPAAISPGGGVFERSAKSIAVSAEMAAALGIDKKKVTPNELVQALLTAPVDLLWLGGIGTFVKAADERQGDVGDRANDACRIDASALRCKVVGEGANLGLTQRARIEFALAGGRINTDAIDNSGGVDTSDHEVNIKIALGEPVRRGELAPADRNVLLEEMTEEVAALVLRDNYLQTQAISLAELRDGELLDQQARMMRALERAGKLDRRLENLPDEETVAERIKQGRGLTRPELAVLLAYAKIALYEDLLHSDVPEDPLLAGDLFRYFPEPLRLGQRAAIEGHRLRREIIATYVTNSMVNRVGPSFTYRMMESTGRSAQEVARAYTITRDAFDLRKVWSAVEALDNKVPARLQLEMLLAAGRLTEHATLWFLRRFDGELDISQVVARFRPHLRELAKQLEPLLPGGARKELRRRAREYQKEGVPEKLALMVAGLDGLAAGVDIVRLAVVADDDVERVARIYFALGERFGLDWLRAAAGEQAIESPWQQSALEMLLDDLYMHQSVMTRGVLAAGSPEEGWKKAVERWLGGREERAAKMARLLEELRAAGPPDLAMLSVAEHQLQQLAS